MSTEKKDVKTIMVELQLAENPEFRESFRIDQAEGILKADRALSKQVQKSGRKHEVKTWVLPTDSKFEFTDDGKIIERAGATKDKGTAKLTGNSAGESKAG